MLHAVKLEREHAACQPVAQGLQHRGEARVVESDAPVAALGFDSRPVGNRQNERQAEHGCAAGVIAVPSQHVSNVVQGCSLAERPRAPVVALKHQHGVP